LVGGKIDQGETPEEALLREAEEEGFILANPVFARSAIVDGKEVAWYFCSFVAKLESYKEQHRILNIFASTEEVAKSFGNEFLLD